MDLQGERAGSAGWASREGAGSRSRVWKLELDLPGI